MDTLENLITYVVNWRKNNEITYSEALTESDFIKFATDLQTKQH